ncbi:hypothetical protein KJ966_13020 [bacterium]|nr:hypothetical protein [bacterium]
MVEKQQVFICITDKILKNTVHDFLLDLNYSALTIHSLEELLHGERSMALSKFIVIMEQRGEIKKSVSDLRQIHECYTNSYVIVLNDGKIDLTAEEFLSCGIYGFLKKPLHLIELELMLIRVFENQITMQA